MFVCSVYVIPVLYIEYIYIYIQLEIEIISNNIINIETDFIPLGRVM